VILPVFKRHSPLERNPIILALLIASALCPDAGKPVKEIQTRAAMTVSFDFISYLKVDGLGILHADYSR
jgi:hypothetical protein